MTGARIAVDFQDAELRGALDRLMNLRQDPKPLLKAVGVGLVKTTQQRFVDAKDPQGTPWKALNPEYAANKRGPGILRERAMRGGLMGSMTLKVEPGLVRVGSNKKYAAAQQFGATIVPVKARALVFRLGKKLVRVHRVVIPARPYLGFGPADRAETLEVVNGFYTRAWAGFGARRGA